MCYESEPTEAGTQLLAEFSALGPRFRACEPNSVFAGQRCGVAELQGGGEYMSSCGCQAQAVRRHQVVSQCVQAQYGSHLCEPAHEQMAKTAGLDVGVDKLDALASAQHRGAIRSGHAGSPFLKRCRLARPFGGTQVQTMRGHVLPVWLDWRKHRNGLVSLSQRHDVVLRGQPPINNEARWHAP